MLKRLSFELKYEKCFVYCEREKKEAKEVTKQLPPSGISD